MELRHIIAIIVAVVIIVILVVRNLPNKHSRRKKPADEKEKLPKPGAIPGEVSKYLVAEKKMALDLAQLLKAVTLNSATAEEGHDIRIFDESEAIAKKVQVKDYATLDEHPDLIIYEGWFNEKAKKVELQERKQVNWDTPIFTEAEIRGKIEALNQPGAKIFFYMAKGPANGGPLGKGAAVIELNPDYPGKKQKKYNLFTADVIDMQPESNGTKLFSSNKSKDLSQWIKESHHKRMY